MTCQEYLARHSDYVDGGLDPREAARLEVHSASCASCSRYDRVVRRGLRLLRELPEIEPSPDFFPRLQHRIYNVEDGLRGGSRASGVGAMLSLAVAGALAVLAWSPLLRLGLIGADGVGIPEAAVGKGGPPAAAPSDPERAAGAAVHLAAEGKEGRGLDPGAPAWGGGVLFQASGGGGAWWWAGAATPAVAGRSPRAVDIETAGPYSPLIVEAPTFRRTALVMPTDGGRIGRD